MLNTTSAWLFVLSNIGITAGYIFLALGVLPRVTVHLTRTKVGGVGFFLLCGLHHLDNVFHYLFQGKQHVEHVFTEWHMIAIDVPQFVCVWLFVTGLYIELVRWGPWRTEDPAWLTKQDERGAKD
jgi:hypothetical protein